MSVIYSTSNCTLISHENYINNVYMNISNDSGSCKINPILFNINKQFKSIKSKPKRNEAKFDGLLKDIEHVRDKYTLFYNEYKLSGHSMCDNVDGDNVAAIEFAKTIQLSKELEKCQGRNDNELSIITKIGNERYLFPPKSRFYCNDVSEMKGKLVDEEFDVILMDPPWWNKAIRRKRRRGYTMMHNEDIKLALPIEELLRDDGLLVIWCTNSAHHLNYLLNECFSKWRVKKCAKWFWLKITKQYEPIIEFGEPPMKLPFEQIVFAAKNPSIHPKLMESDGRVIVSVPSALHSHKPPLDELLNEFSARDGKKLEVFARYLLPNWTSYGLEVYTLQNMFLYT